MAQETFEYTQAEGPEMKLKTEVSDESSVTKRWYAQRKQRRTNVVFCERTLRNVASVRKLLQATRRCSHNSFNTQRELIPTKNRGKQFFSHSDTCRRVGVDRIEGLNPSKDEEEVS